MERFVAQRPVGSGGRARPASLGRGLLLALGLVGMSGMALSQGTGTVDADEPTPRVETYRDWIVRCDTAEGAPQRCEMAQELRQSDGRLVFATLVRRTGPDAAVIVFVAPFGVAVSEGLRFDWGDESAWEVPFATCLATGCMAERVADGAALARLQEATSVAVSMQAYGGDRVELSVSLAGFTGAWRRLDALAAEQAAP